MDVEYFRCDNCADIYLDHDPVESVVMKITICVQNVLLSIKEISDVRHVVKDISVSIVKNASYQ